MNIQFRVQLFDVEGALQTHPSCDMIFLPPQTLKYAFQTHDRLCFVMEYANGGEVRPCVTVTWRPMNVTCCQQQLNVLSETGRFISVHLLSALLPHVTGTSVYRRSGAILRRGDCVGARVPPLS